MEEYAGHSQILMLLSVTGARGEEKQKELCGILFTKL